MKISRVIKWGVGAMLVAAAAAGGGALWYLDDIGVGPRALARRIAPGAGSSQQFYRARRWAEAALLRREEGTLAPIDPARVSIGAQARAVAPPGAGRAVAVSSAAELRKAIGAALPGDVITLAPGTYRLAGPDVEVVRPGAADATITVRAAARATVLLEVASREGFAVYAPYWRFENLSIRGACRVDSECDHAFHVSGDAHHFSAVNNDISDFNAQFKVNGNSGRFPDHGTLEANTLINHGPRRTANSVTAIDLVGASHWTIRRNLIADFVKAGGDGISYGAFAKGGGDHNTFEQNIVWCELKLRGQAGQRIGLSLGGGGTRSVFCRDGKCVTEQDDSAIVSNLVAACSDDGVYINSAARSRVSHNTLLATAGVDLRFATTSADVEGNLVDGPIRGRDGAIVRALDNRTAPVAYRYLGVRANGGWFADGDGEALSWDGAAPRRERARPAPADLCGGARPVTPAYGAFEDFGACRAGRAPD